MARVRGVIAAATSPGSMFRVSGSTSTRTGRAPTCSLTLTEAANVVGVVITSSPGPIPRVTRAVCRPAVRGGRLLCEPPGLRPGRDPARPQGVDDLGDLLLADERRRERQEIAPGRWRGDRSGRNRSEERRGGE